MNGFSFSIVAIDGATATVRKINDSMSKLTRPFDELGKSFKAFGKEAGFQRIGQSLKDLGGVARTAGADIAKIAAPIAGLAGVGTIAGISALANGWARMGSEIARSAQGIGISTNQLQSLRGAAEAAGLSSESLTAGLASLGSTMQDALMGRNVDAAILLSRLGVSIHKTADGAVDSARAFTDMAGAISKLPNPQTQAMVARQFGLEALLPLLRQGPAAIEAYVRKAKEMGAVMTPEQIARAERFALALNDMDLAGRGLRNSIADRLLPVFEPLIIKLTDLISKNREVIAEKVGEWAEKLAKWIDSIDFKALTKGIEDTVKGIGDFVDSIGGWKVAAIGVAAIMAGPTLLAIGSVALGIGRLATYTVPLLITAFDKLATAGGLSGLVSKLGLVVSLSWAALQVARMLGLPDTDMKKGAQDIQSGDWMSASANLPAMDFLKALGQKAMGTSNADIAKGLAAGANGEYAPLLNLVGQAEGTDKGRGYNETLGYGRYTGGPVDLIGMTLKEIDDLQTKMLSNPANTLNSSAVGRYQITRTTLRDMREKMGLTGDEKFDPAMQDRLASYLIATRATGDMRQMQDGLAGIWASFPKADTGASAYGQRTGTSLSSVQAAIQASQQAQAAQATGGPSKMEHEIQISLTGLPPGVQASARRANGQPVQVSVAMTPGW